MQAQVSRTNSGVGKVSGTVKDAADEADIGDLLQGRDIIVSASDRQGEPQTNS